MARLLVTGGARFIGVNFVHYRLKNHRGERVVGGCPQSLSHLGLRFPNWPVAQGRSCDSLIPFIADRPAHDQRYTMNHSKITETLGYHPTSTIEEGLRETLHWYLQNEWWWRGILDESYREWLRTQYRAADIN